MTGGLDLPARLEGAELAPLRQALLERRGGDLDLIGAAVERMNGLGLQVLLSARKTWLADGFTLRVTQPSESLSRAFAGLGLSTAFEGNAS